MDPPEETLKVLSPNTKTKGYIADAFQIFTSGTKCNTLYKRDYAENQGRQMRATVWRRNKTAMNSSTPNEEYTINMIGAGVVFTNNEQLNEGVKWFNIKHNTNNSGALTAIILALTRGGINTPLTFNIRSSTLVDVLTSELPKIEDEGFHGNKDAGLLHVLLGCLRMHKTKITLYDASGDPISHQDIEVKSLANNALVNGRSLVLPPIPEELHLMGARLSNISQALAYRTIRSLIGGQERP